MNPVHYSIAFPGFREVVLFAVSSKSFLLANDIDIVSDKRVMLLYFKVIREEEPKLLEGVAGFQEEHIPRVGLGAKIDLISHRLPASGPSCALRTPAPISRADPSQRRSPSS